MTFLYVFPHPDDESFGPAPVIAKQRREEHAVHLLTLTRGEATSQRKKYGYSKEKMGQVRYEEMQGVAEALDLSSLSVLEFPDGGLDGLDPRVLEEGVAKRIRAVEPDVVVTYAVHGISGHPDHLVTHAVVKRTFCKLQDTKPAPCRLAFFTLPPPGDDANRPSHLRHSPEAAIDAVITFGEEELRMAEAALDCYETYQDVIEKHNPLGAVKKRGVCFECFQEHFDPPLEDLTAGIESEVKNS